MVRLLLALLIALLPMPAAAAAPACHGDAPAMHHQPAPEPAEQAPDARHCIGCVAPATLGAAQVAPPLGFAGVEAAPAASCGQARIGIAPATPPPRLEA